MSKFLDLATEYSVEESTWVIALAMLCISIRF